VLIDACYTQLSFVNSGVTGRKPTKFEVQKSVGSKDRVETRRRPDAANCFTFLVNTVDENVVFLTMDLYGLVDDGDDDEAHVVQYSTLTLTLHLRPLLSVSVQQ